jgi:4-hydroxybenzoate polyprenyltransferase
VKRDLLVNLFGEKGFDYVGNSSADLAVWSYADTAIPAGARPRVVAAARRTASVGEQSFQHDGRLLVSALRAIRPRQWLKNVLVFSVIPASHGIADPSAWKMAILAFFSLSACASALYVVNDVLDIANDRLHAEKKNRPFASGALPIWMAAVLTPLLLAVSFAFGQQLPADAQKLLLAYPVLSFAYSIYLKRVILVDVFMLALLYTFRLLLGAAATGILCSAWLMSFSLFAFLSLALAKRASELRNLTKATHLAAPGRGYRFEDLRELHLFGVASAFAASIVLALYIRSDQVLNLYREPDALWGGVIAFCYWECRIWMLESRGALKEDAIVFAISDRVSYLVVLVISIAVLIATKGLMRIPGLLP